MTVAHRLNTAVGDIPCRADHHLMAERDGVDVRAHLRHLGTVLTISGDIDARNTDRVSAYAARLVPVGNALLLDLDLDVRVVLRRQGRAVEDDIARSVLDRRRRKAVSDQIRDGDIRD